MHVHKNNTCMHDNKAMPVISTIMSSLICCVPAYEKERAFVLDPYKYPCWLCVAVSGVCTGQPGGARASGACHPPWGGEWGGASAGTEPARHVPPPLHGHRAGAGQGEHPPQAASQAHPPVSTWQTCLLTHQLGLTMYADFISMDVSCLSHFVLNNHALG